MIDYNGSKCIICGKEFTENDSIVVCPDCGTPYHADCYKNEGKCVNTELHKNHGTWSPYESAAAERIVCKNCGHINEPKAYFCSSCGFPIVPRSDYENGYRMNGGNGNIPPEVLKQSGMELNMQPFLINFSDPLCGYNPEEDFDGVRLCELGDFVNSNTHYYLPAFKRIKETGRTATWNFAAMLFPEVYFANRKMPLIALVVLLFRIVINIPSFIYSCAQQPFDIPYMTAFAANFDMRSSAFQSLILLTYLLRYVLYFFCGSKANKIYYKHAVAKTAKIKSSVKPQQLRETLRKRGGTSAFWLTTFIILCLMPYLVLYFLMY